MTMKKDNSTFRQKVVLRKEMLKHIESPVIMETHGGLGKLYNACYQGIDSGVVFEKDPRKAGRLGLQRPTWAVYEADSTEAIRAGVGNHLEVNILDLDPYGEPWPTIEAFFNSDRLFPDMLFVAVNDGLRQKLRIGGWDVGSMQGIVSKYGNNLQDIYLDVCRELMQEKAAKAGYSLNRFVGYYCGHAKQMTHYLAELKK